MLPDNNNPKDMLKFERKLLKFWAQSVLLGVPRIIVGFRDAKGILCGLENLFTAELGEKVRSVGMKSWDDRVCWAFADGLLACKCLGLGFE